MRALPTDRDLSVIVYSDGAARSNPGPAGIGALVTTQDGRVLAELGEGIGPATNNVAEYKAAIAGLELAAEKGATRVLLRADSRLLIEQLAGRFKVKNPTLQRLHQEARALIKSFEKVTLEHVRREKNKEADRLANEGVDSWLAENGPYEAPLPANPELFED
ncbi:MAG: ribonuclease HI family protein [Actinomycetota bacterium]